MADDCIFCRLVRGEIPATVVAESDSALAFRDVNPQAPVHVLVVPRRHVGSLADASVEDVAGVVALVNEVARHEGVARSGYRTVINTGPEAGQSVAHLHAHLLGGRHMAWPPG